MDDSISRQAAIDALCDNCDHVEAVCPHYPCKQYIAIENLPPAQPERKKGKWIVYKAPDQYHCGLVKCPFCYEEMIAESDEYNFCPRCGADMRGDQNE